MVVGTTFRPINDVIFVVEDTHYNGQYIQDIKTNYIQPTLENFNGGAGTDHDYAQLKCASAYTLILFKGADCLPA